MTHENSDRPFGSSHQWPGAGNENVDNENVLDNESLALSTKCANLTSRASSKSCKDQTIQLQGSKSTTVRSLPPLVSSSPLPWAWPCRTSPGRMAGAGARFARPRRVSSSWLSLCRLMVPAREWQKKLSVGFYDSLQLLEQPPQSSSTWRRWQNGTGKCGTGIGRRLKPKIVSGRLSGAATCQIFGANSATHFFVLWSPKKLHWVTWLLMGRGFCFCGRRSTQSFRKGCGTPGRRWAVASCGKRNTQSFRKGCGTPARRCAAASVCVAGAVPRALERVAERLVAAGPRLLCLRGTCSTQSFRKGCGTPGRRWAAVSVCVAGAVLRASERVAERLVAAGPRILFRASERFAERLVVAGPRLLSAWQAQYSELQKGLRNAWSFLFAWQAQYSKLQKGLRNAWSPLGRGFCLRGRRNNQSFRRGCGTPGRRWAAASVCVAGAILRAWERVAESLSVWQAQYSELQKGLRNAWSPLGRGFRLRGTRSTQSLRKGCGTPRRRWAAAPVCVAGWLSSQNFQKGLRNASSPLGRGSCLRGRLAQ